MTTTFDQLATEVANLIRREVGAHDVQQVWTDDRRVLFRLCDGRTGDFEVVVNWDVVAGRVGEVPEEEGRLPSDPV